ncbi:MAG: hypothetical protein R3A13_07330 [Bdellovibrionota bacterium]
MIPHSFTPYYRYDTRDFFADSATDDSSFTIDIKRHTFAFRYLPTPNNILKFEYQRNRNEFGPEVEDDMFLVSYVRPF